MDVLRDISCLVENVIVATVQLSVSEAVRRATVHVRSIQQPQHWGVRNRRLVVVRRLGEEAAVDFFTGGAVKIPDLEAEACRLDKGVGEGGDADVVGFTLRGLDVVCAVCLDIAHGNKVAKVIGVRLHPGTGQELRVSDRADWSRANRGLP